MNSNISNVKPLSFTPVVNSTQVDKKTAVEEVKVDKQGQDDVKKVDPDSNVVSLEAAKKLAEEGNEILGNVQRNLQFKVDDATDQVVMTIVDKNTGEVIRQLPSEEALELAKRMLEADGEPGGIVEDSA